MAIEAIWGNPKIRKPLMTILFYVAAYFLIETFHKIHPGGYGDQSLGTFVFHILIPLSIILFMFNFIKTIRGDKTNLIPTIIHFLLISLFVVIFFNGN